jgi:hypothetical protein
MASDFISKNTPSLDKLVQAATTQDEFIGDAYERMKAELRGAMGIIPPSSENEVLYGRSSMPAQPVTASDPSVPQHCVRVVYPHLNDRFEIYGATEADLDVKEAALRALYE